MIGRLVTDEGFRRRFAADPPAALREVLPQGWELNPCELRALSGLTPDTFERFAAAIDPRLLKSDLHGGREG